MPSSSSLNPVHTVASCVGGGPWQGGGGGGWQGPGGYGGPGGYAPEEERPPPGCDPDAYKLYLAGLPKTWELDELRRVAEKFGQVTAALTCGQH